MTLQAIIDSCYDDMEVARFYDRFKPYIDHITIAYHRGSLKECLETEKTITFDEFICLFDSYYFYAYDERIKAFRFLLHNMEKCVVLPTWLHFYINDTSLIMHTTKKSLFKEV